MVDLGEETREDFEDSDVSLPVSSNVGYYHTHHVPRLSSWRQNVQAQEPTSRHSLLEPVRQDFVQVKSDPENTSRFCSSVNNMSGIGTGTSSSPSADAAEDIRMRGQLLQEITRVAETFEPYNGSSTSSVTYRSYTLAPDATQTSDAEYIISDTPQWMWSRNPGDDRSFAGSMGNGLLVGSSQVSEASMGSLQYPVPSQLMPDAFSATLPSLTESEAAASIASSSSMMQRPQQSSSALPSSALDLSPASPVQAASLLPQVVHISCVSTPPVAHQILPSQGDVDPLDPDIQQQQQQQQQEQQAPLSYHQNVEGSLEFGGLDEEENPDDVVDYQPDVKCSQCGTTFMNLQHLKLHIKRDNCAASVQTDEEIQNKSKVPLSSVMEKPKRPQRLQTTQQLFSCKHCNETFSRAEKLKVHELNHSGERPFHCNECAASFNTKTMLARHKKIHTGEKPYSCGECKTCFTESGSLKVHMRLHTGDRPYKCEWCEEAFSGAGMLASHKRKHTGEKPYACSSCGASFRLLSTLKSHSRRHTGEKPFVCELCGSSFTQKAALRRHRRTHLNIKPYECEHCGFKFREKENLRRHRLLHKMKLPFICDICGAGFNNSKKLENHKMLHNGGEKPYECNKCPSSFASPKYLTQHKRRVHERKGSIRCEECNATFNRRETLRSHMRIHKGAGQYICSECGATFNQRATLTRHLRIHGDKAYVETASPKESFTCRLCNTVFSDKTSLESHIMEHRVVEDFAYECPSCYLGFSDQLDLVKHKRIHHPMQRPVASTRVEQDDDNNEPVRDKYVCQDCDQTFFRKRQLKAHKKFCLCKDLDQMEEPEEMKPNVVPQNTNKEVSAMKLVSAVLAAAGNSTSDIDYQLSPSTESLPSDIPFSTVSTPSVGQLSQRYLTPQVSLSHDGMYEHQVDQGHHQVSCQQPPQQDLLHQSANHEIVQSVQGSLPTSAQDHIEQVERQSHMQGQTQGTLSQQSLREDVHHNPFDFDISQHDFYKSLPPQHSSHHHLTHRHDHQDADQESQLLQGSFLKSISQDLEGCDDLHSSMRQWFVPEHREHFREDIRQQREQHRFLPRLDSNMKEAEHNSLPQQHENHYQTPCQSQFHSYDQFRISKLDDKYDDTTQHQQHYVLEDQSTLKTRNLSPKSVGSYGNVRNKY